MSEQNGHTEQDLDRAMARVRKMMNLANDPGAAEGERDNALRMAHATLAKFGMTMAEAEMKGRKEEDRAADRFEVRDFPWCRTVGSAVAKLLFCRFFYSKIGRSGHLKYTFVGRLSNVTTAREMCNYIIQSIQREANQRTRAMMADGNYNRSFCKGAAERVYERCEEIQRNAERESEAQKVPGTALVLASFYKNELAANQAYIDSVLNVRLRTGVDRQRNTTIAGHAAGREYGGTVSLNRQVGGGTTRRLK